MTHQEPRFPTSGEFAIDKLALSVQATGYLEKAYFCYKISYLYSQMIAIESSETGRFTSEDNQKMLELVKEINLFYEKMPKEFHELVQKSDLGVFLIDSDEYHQEYGDFIETTNSFSQYISTLRNHD